MLHFVGPKFVFIEFSYDFLPIIVRNHEISSARKRDVDWFACFLSLIEHQVSVPKEDDDEQDYIQQVILYSAAASSTGKRHQHLELEPASLTVRLA